MTERLTRPEKETDMTPVTLPKLHHIAITVNGPRRQYGVVRANLRHRPHYGGAA